MEERRVRRLHLRATGQSEAQRASIVLEDALRTASLRGSSEPGRLFVVRTLDVGRLPAGGSQASASWQVEYRLREILDHAIFAARPGAGTAPAVYFSDYLQALVLFVQRLSSGRMADEWYWSLAIPGRQSAGGRKEELRQILTISVNDLPSPAAGQAALLASLLEESQLAFEALLDSLDPEDGQPLLAQLGLQDAVLESGPPALQPATEVGSALEPDWQPGLAAISSLWRSALYRWAARWGVQDARLLWLSGMALVAANPPRLIHPTWLRSAAMNLRVRIAEVVSTTVLGMANLPDQAVLSSHYSTTSEIEDTNAQAERRVRPDVNHASDIRELPAALDAPEISQEEESLSVDISGLASDLMDPGGGLATQWSGLYFLLPALTRLGLADFIQEQPEYIELSLPQRIQHRVATLAGVPEGDPVLMPLIQFSGWQGHDLTFVAPTAWAGLLPSPEHRTFWRLRRRGDKWLLCSRSGLSFAIWTSHIPDGADRWLKEWPGKIRWAPGAERGESVQPSDLVVDAWVRALRLWIRLVSGLSLVELLRRPGRVYINHTHLEIILPLAAADLRIRRAGLDLDPGWLPWLGRVVQFKYLEE